MRRYRALLFSGLLSLVAASAGGQQIIRMPGKTIEVVGLTRWTIPMIQDSLAKYSPGDSLHHHACAATLRYKLGFADAAAIAYRGMFGPQDTTEYLVISVVEPQDSARVRYKTLPFDSLRPRAEWREGIELLRARPGAVHASLNHYAAAAKTGFTEPLPAYLQRDSATVRAFWRFLATHKRDADRKLALSVIASDANFRNRAVAAAILANFGSHDSTWFALLESMRETDGIVKGVAATVLTSMASTEPRTVDWTPAATTIHAMLDGTSLFEFSEMLEVLSATGLGPRWSRPFLAQGGEMLLAHAAAELPILRHAAHRFLTTISGQDFGSDVQRWRGWIAGL